MSERHPPSLRESLARLDTLREQGVHRTEPVRWCVAEALARRAGSASGPVRQAIVERLDRWLDALARGGSGEAGRREVAVVVTAERRGPLGQLVDELHARDAHGLDAEHAPRQASMLGAVASPPELKALARSRGTWKKLHTERRLRQSRSRLPQNAGPLNTQHLVHRALKLMHEVSPDCLDRFMGYAEALFWLDALNQAAGPRPATAPQATPAVDAKPSRARRSKA